ncbi:hypothetical protein F5X99DRAFT_368048 [Biscogniauxia marginata]|nr:hypothetical protein F5X99DRAFT_368048 [Biscogniauxia marginata]
MSVSSSQLGLSCPSKGTFYVCEHAEIRFIGCCTVDPCADGSGVCPQANLAASSFSSDSYNDIRAQSCVAPYNSSTWWTCTSASGSPFLGCCKEDPCGNECKQSDLLPARLSDDEFQAQVFLSGTTTSENADSNGGSGDGNSGRYTLSLGAILGISLGSAALVAIILGFLMYRCGWWARHKRSQKEVEASNHYSASTPGQYSPGFPSPWLAMSQPGSPEPSPGYPPYTTNAYLHAPSSTTPSEPWQRDSRHISELSGMSWDTVAASAAQKPSTPLLSGQHVIAELPTSPTTNKR